jgi:hypothetical protein
MNSAILSHWEQDRVSEKPSAKHSLADGVAVARQTASASSAALRCMISLTELPRAFLVNATAFKRSKNFQALLGALGSELLGPGRKPS